MAEPHGEITIDGIRTTDIGLHDLRRNISIIPQVLYLLNDYCGYFTERLLLEMAFINQPGMHSVPGCSWLYIYLVILMFVCVHVSAQPTVQQTVSVP